MPDSEELSKRMMKIFVIDVNEGTQALFSVRNCSSLLILQCRRKRSAHFQGKCQDGGPLFHRQS